MPETGVWDQGNPANQVKGEVTFDRQLAAPLATGISRLAIFFPPHQ